MSNNSQDLSPLKRAYLALEKMQARLKAVEQAKQEPIAIVGVGCRFPGADGPDAFWQMLREGVDAVAEVPADRWDVDTYYDPDPEAPGKMSTRWGAFLQGVDQFEPQFFGISPREAVSMDPQQRLLLEVTWEALEHAGLAPDQLSGSRTGVFVGIVNSDYNQIQGKASQIDAYYGSGGAHSIASGRLSYVLGLQGPSISLDTACSSSLVAVHLACQSLRGGECNLALAGGVNVILVPETTVALTKFHMMAPDGRCKTFDARADGFVRGEGCGLIVLKRLSDALANGDNILAVIRGSAVNQDGPSSGLTAPNGPSQEAVVREALANAGMSPADIGYIETHGTGTSLGDPIEVQALGTLFGKSHDKKRPLLLGSVKTNIGHLESAAGIAGLIKLALALHQREIPPHLHLQTPNPFIPWEELPVAVPTTLTAWPADVPLAGGVSSFGFSGTNAHVVLEAAPQGDQDDGRVEKEEGGERPLHLLTLSARSEPALQQIARQYSDFFEAQPAVSLADVALTANTGRARLPHRLALAAATTAQAQEKLAAFAAGELVPGVVTGWVEQSDPRKIAFLFTGQGAQYVGMGQQLYDTEPTFRAALDECNRLLRPHLERPLLSILFNSQSTIHHSPFTIDDTVYTQPALFALEYALAQLWLSWGIRPDVVVGHSVGEFVAACIAGVFSLEDGLKLIAARGRLMQALPAGGAMAAVFAGEAQVAEAIAPFADDVSIAAVNGPENVVISGAGAVVQAILEKLTASGIKSKPLIVSHAFHSPLMEPMLDDFARLAATVTYQPPQISLIANVSGELATGSEVTSAAYWREHVRRPVRFAAAVQRLHEIGVDTFIEIGPSPTLLGMAQRIPAPENKKPLWLPSLRPARDDWQQLLASLGQLAVGGADIDWQGFDRNVLRRRLRLPTYPFQRARYWLETAGSREASLVHNSQFTMHNAPLLGRRLRSPLHTHQFELLLHGDSFAFLADHRVYGVTILPAAAYLEMALAAAREILDEGTAVEELVIHEALVVPADQPRLVQIIVTPAEMGADFQIFSAAAVEADGSWSLHAEGQLRPASEADVAAQLSLEAIQERCREVVSAADHYHTLADHGLDFGPSLHGVAHIWRRDGEALAEVQLPTAQETEAGVYQMHPALLDACLQALGAAIPQHDGVAEAYLPVALERFRLLARPAARLWSHATLRKSGQASGYGDTLVAEIHILDEAGAPVAELQGLRLRRAGNAAMLRAVREGSDDWFYEMTWQPHSLPQPASPREMAAVLVPRQIALADRHGLARHHEMVQALDEVSTAIILRALQQLGWRPQPGEQVTAVTLADKLGILPQHHRLLRRLLEILAEDGLLTSSGGEVWQLEALPSPTMDVEARLAALRADYPASQAFAALLQHAGGQLAAALSGASDPLQILFPDGSTKMVEALYQDSPEAHVFNTLAQEAMVAALAQLAVGQGPQQTVRILEVGAGTGGTTASVLPALPPERTEYTFTDISPHFLSRAQEKFAAFPFMRYQLLNVEQDPQSQGMEGRQFDVILAVNVLHATADLRQALRHLRGLLAPGGLLLLLEGTAPERWIDLTFGLTDGWWRFKDTEVRQAYPLVSRRQWFELLAEAGFVEVTAVPQQSELSQQALIIGRASQENETVALAPGAWLIFADEGGVGAALAGQLRARGETCRLAVRGAPFAAYGDNCWRIDPANPDDYRRLLQEVVTDESPLRGLVHLWGLDVETPVEQVDVSLEPGQFMALGSAVYLLQALGSAGWSGRFWLGTRGAQPVTPGPLPPAVVQAPLWGLGRVIALEHPDLHCTRVDLDPAAAIAAQAELLLHEMRVPPGEDQVAFRGETRYVARLARAAVEPSPLVTGEQPLALRPSGQGVLDDIMLEPAARRAPGPSEVEIRVLATGLNFRDVMNALAMRADPEPLGSECGGLVVAVGEGVSGLQVGDAVLAVAPGSFSTFVTVKRDLVVHKPEHLTFAEAATLPMAFLTAHYALNCLAQVVPSERVLIHAAAGGVGMAAVQLAQRAGAEIFATAGSPQKRAFLRSLGVAHVLDSRSLAFRDEIMALTGGEGVDVVLNSLAGDFIAASVQTMAPQGRFLEIGKRDIWTAGQFAAVRPQGSYHVVDLSALMYDNPPLVREMFHELAAAVQAGEIKPLPLQTFPLAQAGAAFRHMAQARHIGKIVLTQNTQPPGELRPYATYLISGGLAGLGLLTAQWLVERGARSLVLMGRSQPSAEASAAIAGMEAAGAQVKVVQGDVGDAQGMAELLAEIGTTMPPLRGVIHSAGVLADGVLQRQEWSRFRQVMVPKVEGSWILHTLTRGLELDFFVLYSSVAAVFGSPGQGNHAAVNAFLDALAHYRRLQGLPALSINWGVWSQIGAAAARGVGERVAEQGVGTIAPQQGLQALERLMHGDRPQAAVMPMQWPQYLAQFGAGAPRWLAQMVAEVQAIKKQIRPGAGRAANEATTTAQPDFLRRLAEAPANQQRDLLLSHVHGQVVKVLGIGSDETVHPRQPLNELGLDSLMAVELRNLLGTSLALKRALPATLVFDYPTLDALTDYLAREVLAPGTAAQAESGEETADMVQAIETLSDEEVERLLTQLHG